LLLIEGNGSFFEGGETDEVSLVHVDLLLVKAMHPNHVLETVLGGIAQDGDRPGLDLEKRKKLVHLLFGARRGSLGAGGKSFPPVRMVFVAGQFEQTGRDGLEELAGLPVEVVAPIAADAFATVAELVFLARGGPPLVMANEWESMTAVAM
jgi:hypothetical protein